MFLRLNTKGCTMRFLDIFVERFGVLKDSKLSDLSRGMTVVYGGNGAGKTTLVNFLHGMLFGYTTDHQAFQVGDQRFGGSVSVEAKGRSYRVTRERKHGISTDLSSVDLATGVSVAFNGCGLPAWVNESVYREVFSVGDQEASRFDLLSRLCLEGDHRSSSADEIRCAEMAIEQAIAEREGNGFEGGLRQRMTALQRRREDLERQLTEMRRTSPEIPARIAEIESEIRRLQSSLVIIEQQIREVESRIAKLDEMLVDLRRRNVVSLDRAEVEAHIHQLQERQRRWQAIKDSVNRELAALRTQESVVSSRSSLKSIRALVSRLEERVEVDRIGNQASELTRMHGVAGDHLRSEVYSLCEHVSRHESAVAAHEASQEVILGKRALHETVEIEALLTSQIAALRAELTHADDVISACANDDPDCRSSAHRTFARTVTGHVAIGSIEECEAELQRLRSQLIDLRENRSRTNDRIHSLQSELLSLKSQLKASASLEDIDRVKSEIAEVDAKLGLHRNRWSVLEETERNLREVVVRLGQYRIPQVLSLASKYIARLTDGDCFALESDRSGASILARTRQSTESQSLKQLSRGTRDQVALALRLALIQCRAEEERCPLILDDVFISADDERAAAVADLLMEVASDGQQIIFFTCQNDVRELFARRHASIRHLEERTPVVVVPDPPVVVRPVAVVSPPPVVPQPPARPSVSQKTNWLFYLEVDNSIEDLSGLTVAEIEAFRAAELETIDDLLSISVEDLEALFLSRGYSIGRDRIRAWRGQAELATRIPMLRRSDAELLYESGIQTTVELSRMRPENVFDSVSAFQTSSAGARYRRSGRTIDRQQAINWSRWSQHARSLTEARQARSRFFVRTSDTANSPHSAPRGVSDRTSSVLQRRVAISRGVATTRCQRRPRLSMDASRQRDARISRRRERLAQHSSSYRTSLSSSQDADSTKELRFYLSRSNDVEAAPSIGEKTAQRLGQIGIYTVDDLLNANSTSVAERLNNRRITPETIEQWQAQARLVCQVPELRGHDAQILVACGVTEPEQLSTKRPVDLFAIVGPFADTTEGERIVRGGRKPDLEEVTDWIRFAQQARSLRSAA